VSSSVLSSARFFDILNLPSRDPWREHWFHSQKLADRPVKSRLEPAKWNQYVLLVHTKWLGERGNRSMVNECKKYALELADAYNYVSTAACQARLSNIAKLQCRCHGYLMERAG
jgi:hypothetical protein